MLDRNCHMIRLMPLMILGERLRPRPSNTPMSYRKLRIAWSVGCSITCVLLIVLWMRSYWWSDQFVASMLGRLFVGGGSQSGAFGIGVSTDSNVQPWTWMRQPIDERKFWSWMLGVFLFRRGAVTVPYWFIVPLSATLGVLPLYHQRFSLRTLLIATTLVAVVLGLSVYAMRTH